jgi:hypothetical protein
MRHLKTIFFFALLGSTAWLVGCAQVIIPGTMAGAGEYMRYTTTNVPKRTLDGNPREVSAAAYTALRKMNIKAPADQTKISPITATTAELLITISLEPVTPTTTRVTVDAAKGQVVKDKATADKILDQIEAELSNPLPTKKNLSRIFLRNNCNSPIDVAVHYLDGDGTLGNWRSDGWFRVMPGEKRSVVSTAGRYVYFYAVSPEDQTSEWSGTHYQSLQGGRYGFFKVDLGPGVVDFTQSFNCET